MLMCDKGASISAGSGRESGTRIGDRPRFPILDQGAFQTAILNEPWSVAISALRSLFFRCDHRPHEVSGKQRACSQG